MLKEMTETTPVITDSPHYKNADTFMPPQS